MGQEQFEVVWRKLRKKAEVTDLFDMHKYNPNMELEQVLTGLVWGVGTALTTNADPDIHMGTSILF